jgi:hypothetical protein
MRTATLHTTTSTPHIMEDGTQRVLRLSIPRLVGYWLLLAVVMSANGIFRELALGPVVGRARADVVSAGLGISMILAVTYRAYRSDAPHWMRGWKELRPAAVSASWLTMTVAFEELFGHYVDGKSWSELAANYALWRGRLWPLVLLTVVLAPFLWGRAKRKA